MAMEIGVVRGWEVDRVEGDTVPLNAASLGKQVVAHLASRLSTSTTRSTARSTVRHVLSHTTGLPNWSPPDEPLLALRPPGTGFGYSGEGFALLQRHLEHRTGRTLDDLAQHDVFTPHRHARQLFR